LLTANAGREQMPGFGTFANLQQLPAQHLVIPSFYPFRQRDRKSQFLL
jgi:hypothetical protein